jgi:N4-gp56 family major capsid protein
MTVTETSLMTNSVKTAYDKMYLFNLMMSRVWFDFVDWQDPVGGDLRGSTITQPVMEELAPATTALTENIDLASAVALADDTVPMTIYEYGNAVQLTRFLRIVSFTAIEKAAAKVVGQNQAKSIDLLIRECAVAGTLVLYPLAVATRAALVTATDTFTYTFAVDLMTMAASMGMPPFEDGSYAAIVHPAVVGDIQKSTEWIAVGEYADPKALYTGRPGQIYTGAKFKGEIGRLGGLRIISHRLGKMFLAGGAPLQTATTCTEPIAAGDTSCTVASATGLVVGNWLTLDKGLATEEQVLITAVNTLVLTVRGVGNKFTNFGFKYAHLDDCTAVEGVNVASIPIFGPNSLRGRFASEVGKNGEVRIEKAATLIPGRFINHSWYTIHGFARMEKYLLRGECAVTGGLYGDNK